MEPSSSGRNRDRNSGAPRNRNRNRSRSGDSADRPERSGGGRSRRPEPKPTGWQKFVKAVTFGLVDLTKSKKKGRKPAGKRPERRRIVEEPTTTRLYVGNLSYDLTDEELGAAFSPVGSVVSAAVVRHGDSGRSKGFGFVEMSSVDEAKAAVSKLNDTDLGGRQMLVSGAKAEKRTERPPRESGGRERRSRDDRPPRREGGRSNDRERRSGGRGRSGSEDRIEKPTHQVKPAEIPVVTSPALKVLNLNKDATKEDIADLFDGIGTVAEQSEISVKEGAVTGELHVVFTEVEAAQRVVEVIDLKSFMGHQLRVRSADGEAPAPVTAPAASEPEAPAAETVAAEEVAADEVAADEVSSEELAAEEVATTEPEESQS